MLVCSIRFFEFAFCAAHEFVGETRGFGQPVMGSAPQNKLPGLHEIHQVAHADEQRIDPVLGADDFADHFVMIQQPCVASAFWRNFVMRPDQTAFGASDRRHMADYSDVAGDSDSTRVGQSLTVAHEQIGALAEFAEDGQQRRYFAKGEQTGNIRKHQRPKRSVFLDGYFPVRIPEHNARDALFAIGRKCRIQTGDVTDRDRCRIARNNRSEALLNLNGRLGRKPPRMRSPRNLHAGLGTGDFSV